jgi:peptidoglycan/LPS O-acetylase OafA/YrhL
VIVAGFAILAKVLGHSDALLPHYLPLFAIGILAFRQICLKAQLRDTLWAMLAATLAIAWTNGVPQALAAAASCGAILFLEVNVGVLDFFGEISYSLYLVHVFIGNMIFGSVVRYSQNGSSLKWFLPFLCLGVSIGVAYAMHWAVERPSRRWSSRVRYSPAKAQLPAGLSPAGRQSQGQQV